MNSSIRNLQPAEICNLGSLHTFEKDFIIFHHGQIPTTSLYIHQGNVHIKGSKNRILKTLEHGKVYFVEQLIKQLPLKQDVLIQAGATITLTDRTSILNHLKLL